MFLSSKCHVKGEWLLFILIAIFSTDSCGYNWMLFEGV